MRVRWVVDERSGLAGYADLAGSSLLVLLLWHSSLFAVLPLLRLGCHSACDIDFLA